MKKSVVAIFGILVGVLLVGQRFGATWAGGDGYMVAERVAVEHVMGEPSVDRAGRIRSVGVGDVVQRGETIITGAESFVHVQIGDDTELFIAQNTRVTLDDLTTGAVEIYLRAGRIHVRTSGSPSAPLVRTGWTFTQTSRGETAFVYYDFQDTVVIAPEQSQSTAIVLRATNEGLITNSPVSIHEVAPVKIDDVTFSPSGGDAAIFWEWVQGKP